MAQEIDRIAQMIIKDFSTCPDAVVGSIVACLLELPHKTDLYATLLGVLNIGKSELVALCLDRLNTQIGDMKWWHLVQVFRIAVELTNTNVLSAAYLNSLLLECCQKHVDTSASGELTAVAVLLALPWIKPALLGQLSNLEQVMNLVGAVAENKSRYSHHVSQFDVKISEFEFQNDSLMRLYLSVRTLSTFEGRTEPYKTFEGVLSESRTVDSFSFALTRDSVNSISVQSFSPLAIFPDAVAAEKGDFYAFHYQYMLHMLVEAFELNHRRAAEVLFSCLPESLATPEKIICQVLFGKLVHATEPAKITYYEVLLIDCCRLSRLFPPMMARSLMRLVTKMDMSADLSVLSRLASWFAHHLSHYDFKWNWAEWKAIAESSTITTQRIFLRLLIHRLLLLSYEEKMESVLPEFMLPMLPFEDSSATPSESLNKEVLELFRDRPSLAVIQSKFSENGWKIDEDIFEVMLKMGSKTFSHLLNSFERYSALFKGSSRESQTKCVNIVLTFWSNNPQNIHIVLEKMIHYHIVDAEVVIECLFAKAAELFTSLTIQDVKTFEVELLIKLLSPELLVNLIRKVGKSGQPVFAKSVFERLVYFGSSFKVEDLAASVWLSWTVTNVSRFILRTYFASDLGNIEKKQLLLEMTKNSFPQEVSAMLVGIVESMN